MPNTDAWPLTPGSGRNCMVDHDLTAPDTTANTDTQIIKLLGGKSQVVTGLVGSTYVDGGATSADTTALMVDVRPKATSIAVTPTITASSAYSTGQCLGALMSFSSAVRATSGSLLLAAINIVDADKQGVPVDLVLFNAAPTATTDKTTFNPSKADLQKCVGVVPVGAYATFSTTSIASVNNVGLEAILSGGTTLTGQLVIRGAPTYTTTSSIVVTLTILQD